MDNNENTTIDIAFCCDNNYLKYVAIAIQSISLNNQNNLLRFHVFLYDVSEDDADKLNLMNSDITIYHIPKVYLDNYDNEYAIKHLNRSMYLRLFVPGLLKNKVDKLIYLDADILCFRDISTIHLINIDEFICAACIDSLDEENVSKNVQRLNLSTQNYFNSGMLYINVKNWNDFNTEEKVNKILLEKSKQFFYPDQDALNIVLQNNVLIINPEWNYLYTWITDNEKKFFFDTHGDLPYFVHFTGARKPWYKEHIGIAQNLYLFYKYFTPYKKVPLESYKEKMRITDYRIYAKNFFKRGHVLKAIKYGFLYIKLKLRN